LRSGGATSCSSAIRTSSTNFRIRLIFMVPLNYAFIIFDNYLSDEAFQDGISLVAFGCVKNTDLEAGTVVLRLKSDH
jgi:hypothetical protein